MPPSFLSIAVLYECKARGRYWYRIGVSAGYKSFLFFFLDTVTNKRQKLWFTGKGRNENFSACIKHLHDHYVNYTRLDASEMEITVNHLWESNEACQAEPEEATKFFSSVEQSNPWE